jgi:hypothetical protein
MCLQCPDAQPKQEQDMPKIGCVNHDCDKCKEQEQGEPQQRTWVGLTDEDDIDWEEGGNLKDLVKAIEAKLREKNHAGA